MPDEEVKDSFEGLKEVEQSPEDGKSPFDIEVPESLPFSEASEEPGAEEEKAVSAEIEPTVEDESVTFDEAILDQATKVGLPESVAKSFGSQRELVGYLARLKALESAPSTPSPGLAALTKPEKFDLQIDTEVMDPDFAKQLIALNDHYHAQQVKTFERMGSMAGETDRVARLEKYIAGQAQKSQVDVLEEFVLATEGRRSVFGSKRLSELTPNSDDYQKWNKLYKAADRLRRGYLAGGEPAPSYQDLLAKAFRSEFGDESAAGERNKIEKSVQKRKGQMTARPTQKDIGEEPRSYEGAVRAVGEKMREHGMASPGF